MNDMMENCCGGMGMGVGMWIGGLLILVILVLLIVWLVKQIKK
jgi:hypothetical protein